MSTDDVESKVVALPELRGGLLPHVLKRIKVLTGVYSCELQNSQDGAQVLIKGPWEHLPHCAEIVLSAAVGNFQDLDESVPEVYHDVLPKPKLSTKDAQGFDALQLVGHQTGCDLTLVGSQLQVQGVSHAVARGAVKMIERFLASEIEDVHEFLQDLKAPTGPSSTGANGARPSGPPVRPNAPVQPAHAAPVPAARREQTKRIVEIAGLSRKDLLTCNGLVIRKLQDLHAVHVKILDPKDIPNLPEDTLPLRITGSANSIEDCEGILWQLAQNDFSALGFVLDELRLARTDAEALAGKEKGRKDTRFLVPLMRSWQEALQVDVTLSAEKGPSVVQIRLCGEPDQLAALKSAVGSLLVLSERLAKLLNGSLAKNTKLLKDIFMEVLEQRLPRPVQEEDASLTGDKGEAAQLRKICRRWGQEALELLGRSFVLKTLGFVGRRFEGLVQESVSEVGGDEVFAIECDELERVVRDGTVAVPLSESKELDLKVKVGQCVSFRLTLLEDLPTAADLELAAWRPPMTRPPAPHAPDRAPVIEMRVDEMGRRYFWNHSDATSSWIAPPPHIGFWQRQADPRSGRPYYTNPGTRITLWELPLPEEPPPGVFMPTDMAPVPAPAPAPMAAYTVGVPSSVEPMAPPGPSAAAARPTPTSSAHARIPPTSSAQRAGGAGRSDGDPGFSGAERRGPSSKATDSEEVRPTPSPSTLAPPEASPPATPASPQESPDEGRTALDSMIDEQTALDKIIQEAQQREDEADDEASRRSRPPPEPPGPPPWHRPAEPPPEPEPPEPPQPQPEPPSEAPGPRNAYAMDPYDPYGEWDDRDREGPPGQGDEEEVLVEVDEPGPSAELERSKAEPEEDDEFAQFCRANFRASQEERVVYEEVVEEPVRQVIETKGEPEGERPAESQEKKRADPRPPLPRRKRAKHDQEPRGPQPPPFAPPPLLLRATAKMASAPPPMPPPTTKVPKASEPPGREARPRTVFAREEEEVAQEDEKMVSPRNAPNGKEPPERLEAPSPPRTAPSPPREPPPFPGPPGPPPGPPPRRVTAQVVLLPKEQRTDDTNGDRTNGDRAPPPEPAEPPSRRPPPKQPPRLPPRAEGKGKGKSKEGKRKKPTWDSRNRRYKDESPDPAPTNGAATSESGQTGGARAAEPAEAPRVRAEATGDDWGDWSWKDQSWWESSWKRSRR